MAAGFIVWPFFLGREINPRPGTADSHLMRYKIAPSNRRHSGMAMIYVVITIVALMGFTSFAVDLGRYQTCKTELRRAADAAARAAVASIPLGTSLATSAATNMAANDKADGLVLNSTNATVTVTFLHWTSSTNHSVTSGVTSSTNAVRVTIQHTVPLLFGQVVGISSKSAVESSTAALVQIQQTTQSVSAQSNLWLSGAPKGTLGSEPDGGYSSAAHPYKYDVAGDPSIAYGQPGGPGSAVAADYSSTGGKVESTDYNNEQLYNSIQQFTLTVTPGSVIQVSNVSGTANNQGEFTGGGSGTTTADGSDSGTYAIYSDDAANPGLAQGSLTTAGSEHGISNIETPINSLNGVFLNNNAPETEESTVPPGLNFSTQTERDYTSIQPELQQSFYVGTGLTSTDTQQTIVVPANATRLFLGTMDGHEWANNVGAFNVTITQYQIAIVN
jgi:Flp pilus assembly protein TadG